MKQSGKNYRSGICLFLGLGGRGSKYKCMQLEISYVAGQCKEIYSNENKMARILGQGFDCFWALEKEKAAASMCSLK